MFTVMTLLLEARSSVHYVQDRLILNYIHVYHWSIHNSVLSNFSVLLTTYIYGNTVQRIMTFFVCTLCTSTASFFITYSDLALWQTPEDIQAKPLSLNKEELAAKNLKIKPPKTRADRYVNTSLGWVDLRKYHNEEHIVYSLLNYSGSAFLGLANYCMGDSGDSLRPVTCKFIFTIIWKWLYKQISKFLQHLAFG